MKPMEIEKKSFEIIAEELAQRYPGQKADPEYDLLIRRVIHTTADFEYFETLSFSEHAVEKMKAALANGCDIVTDTTMAQSGINKKTLAQFGGQIHCFIADEDVACGFWPNSKVCRIPLCGWSARLSSYPMTCLRISRRCR